MKNATILENTKIPRWNLYVIRYKPSITRENGTIGDVAVILLVVLVIRGTTRLTALCVCLPLVLQIVDYIFVYLDHAVRIV